MYKKILHFWERYWFIVVLGILCIGIFAPLLVSHQIAFSSNLLTSFFNPWAQEKFSGWLGGIPNKPVGIDDLRIFYPQRAFTMQSLKAFQIPFWNPYNFSGNYHAGLSETAVFYPLFALFLFLPQLPVWIMLQLAEPLLACVGMYFFLKSFFKSSISAGFGAIVFGFSSVILVRMVEGLSVGHTLIWLPWVFFGIEAFVQKKKIRFLLVATFALSLSLLAGWFQYTFYIFFISFFYGLVRGLQQKGKYCLLLLIPFLLAPLLTLFHSIPALEMLQVSTRYVSIQSLLDAHLMPWYHIFTFFSPDLWGNPGTYNFFGKSEYKESVLYIGTIPFALSLFGLFYFRKNSQVLFFFVFALLGVLLGVDTILSRFLLSFPIPLVSSFLPNRIFIFPIFGLSALSAYGLSYFLEEKKNSKIFAGLILLIIFSMLIIASRNAAVFTHGESEAKIFTKNLFLGDVFIFLFVLLILLKNLFRKRLFLVGIFGLTMLGQIYFAQKYIPWSQSQFVFPQNPVFAYLSSHQGIGRFISLGDGYIPSDIPLFFGLYSPDGVGSMYIKRYGELITYVQSNGRNVAPVPRIEIRINPTTKSLFTSRDLYMLRFMQIDGINHIVKLRNEVSPEGMLTNGTNIFSLVWENNTWQIFSYSLAMPHVFWTNQYVVEKTSNGILKNMFDFNKSPQRIVLEQESSLPISPQSTGSVVVVKYQPQQILLKTNATGNGFVFLSDTYTPNFKVTIDGRREELLRADYAFRAIAVPGGVHTILIAYEDTKEFFAFLVSGIVFAGVMLALWKFRKFL